MKKNSLPLLTNIVQQTQKRDFFVSYKKKPFSKLLYLEKNLAFRRTARIHFYFYTGT